MGRQLVFHLGPSDMQEVELRVKKVEEVLIIHSRSDKPEHRILESTDFKQNGKQWLFFTWFGQMISRP
jgi:hypothetical protein